MHKIKDIETRINNKNVDIGDIGCRFYTEDENTAYVRIGINDEKGRINFKESNLTPKLHLFTEDGSIFKNEPILIDDNVKGFLTYKIPKNVIKHVGMVRCKLFLENDHERIHVANFHFYIIDSGIDDAVKKEVSITLVEDTVKRIIRTNASELLGDDFKETLNTTAKQYIADNADKFKGERGEKGEAGERGAQGVPGVSADLTNAIGNFANLKDVVNLPLQTNFVEEVNKLSTTKGDMTVSIVHAPSQTLHVVQPISSSRALRVWFNKNQKDDYIIFRETEIGDYTNENKSIGYQNLEMVDSSMFNTSYAPNYYATTVGATLKGTIIADKINFTSYCNNVGGIWEAILDEGTINEQRKTISTYSSTNKVDNEQLLFDNLDYKKHTLKLVYKGQDPSYPVSSPRGWLYFGGARPQDVKGTINVFKLVPVVTNVTQSLYSYSNKDVAMQIRDANNSTGEQFVPEHNGIATAFKNKEAKLLGDNKELPFITDRVYTDVKNVSLVQNVNGRVDNNDLVNIITNHSIKNGAVSIYGNVKFLKNTYVKTAYTGMVPYFTKNVNKIKSSLNNTYKPDVSGTYRIEKIPEKLQAKSYVLSNDTNDVITAFEFENIIKTNRINDNAIKGDTWIEHRNADMGKIYNQQFKEETIEAGYEWQFKLNYRTTEIPYANTLI
ncbi:TPA: phage baseplate upper protein [Staphylococcus aureus]|nr:phage baseplate upper protein [Staphylococcus aureus]HDT6182155.1 phage baseplate upper protein [Staphylococcus aureus]HDT6226495.1 phage baseplate upper protein [Staphylococcus aureus]HDV4519126.1 phage baseplate upper protein [Staphylococcus aureus]HDV4524669.1 phage baseplate upper protein [Staphylococcus aureus]